MAWSSARVVVTGAAGFIGRWVARKLTGRCGALHLFVRDADRADRVFERWGVTGVRHCLDLTHFDAVRRQIEAIKPAVVLNLAGYGVDRTEQDKSLAYQINENLVGALAEALAEHRDRAWGGCCLIHTGSALEYGDADGNLREDTEPKPTTLYGLSKRAGTRRLTQVCQSRDVPGCTIRLFTVYGPGENKARLLPTLLAARAGNGPIDLSAGLQQRDFTYVEDVADGLLRIAPMTTGCGEVINLATGRLTSVRRFVEIAASVLGIDRRRLRFGAIATRAEEMRHQPVCVDRLRRLVHWTPSTSIEQAVALTGRFMETP